MKDRYEEMGIDFLSKDQIQKYIVDHLTPRLWFIKKHIERIARSEEDFPKEVLESDDINRIIEAYDELERNDATTYECEIKDELQSYNILKNEKYERLGTLRTVLDKKRRVH